MKILSLVLLTSLVFNVSNPVVAQVPPTNANITESKDSTINNTSSQKRVGVIFIRGKIVDKTLSSLVSTVEEMRIKADVQELLLIIDSVGGNSVTGIEIYNYLSALPLTVKTYALEEVMSAAIPIYCSGKIRTASPYSSFMVHNSKLGVQYTNDNVKLSLPDFVESQNIRLQAGQKIDARYQEITSACTGLSQDTVKKMYDNEIYLSPSEAKNQGFVQGIEEFPNSFIQELTVSVADIITGE